MSSTAYPSRLNRSDETIASLACTQNETPVHQTKFRRKRSTQACQTCQSRKTRCDRIRPGATCARCLAFQVECRVLRVDQPKKNSSRASKIRKRIAVKTPTLSAQSISPSKAHDAKVSLQEENPSLFRVLSPKVGGRPYLNLLPGAGFSREPITNTQHLTHLGETCSIALLEEENFPEPVEYFSTVSDTTVSARLEEVDPIEVTILARKGSFLLPPRPLCDELIDAYFRWIHPIIPILDGFKFMRQYRDRCNPPSLLLLQSILLAASRLSTNRQLTDLNGSTLSASKAFYRRAKALYDANYEKDRVTVVQSLILIGWHWDGSDGVVKNVYYWGRVAIIIAQDSGMHRSVQASQLSSADKKTWKRIWWTLVSRDRSIAVAFGRPVIISPDDCDVEALTEEDFIDDFEPASSSHFRSSPKHVSFFLRYLELTEIMGRIQRTLYSATSMHRQNSVELLRINKSLTGWLRNCPDELFWPSRQYNFWSALLHLNYYTALCMLHRVPLSAGSSSTTTALLVTWDHPLSDMALHAAAMITYIVEQISEHDQLRYCPAFMVHALFSAMVMHVHQMRSPEFHVRWAVQGRLYSCMQVMKSISQVWFVGKMVYKLMEFIVDNKLLQERLS